MNNKIHNQTLLNECAPSRGRGVRVALLDTGIDLSHPVFKHADILFKDFCYSSTPGDRDGHGTHCAGTILDVAPACTLFVARLWTEGGMFTYDSLIDGLQWSLQNKVDVVCICNGSRHSDPDVESLISNLVASQCEVVASIGNGSRSDKDAGLFPARYPGVIAAGSIDENNNLLPFVETPAHTDLFCLDGSLLPGPGLNGGYTSRGGTSVSAALISGLIALKIANDQIQKIDVPIKSLFRELMERKEKASTAYYCIDPLKLF